MAQASSQTRLPESPGIAAKIGTEVKAGLWDRSHRKREAMGDNDLAIGFQLSVIGYRLSVDGLLVDAYQP
jgi:hypothetical protein